MESFSINNKYNGNILSFLVLSIHGYFHRSKTAYHNIRHFFFIVYLQQKPKTFDKSFSQICFKSSEPFINFPSAVQL